MPKRVGRKSAAQTPAPPSERIYGSKKNPKGSASSEQKAASIKLSEQTESSLKKKLDEFKKKYPNKKNVTLADLKAVYRRGSGAYSSSHRPTISGGAPNTRNAWALARVNKFLEKAAGNKVKKAYVQDDDLLKYAKGGLVAPNGKPSNLTPEQYKLVRTPEFKAWFGDWENDPENSSKVVDENGEPLMVFHGTKDNFSIFDVHKVGHNTYNAQFGFYFSNNINVAYSYKYDENDETYKGVVLSCFLNIRSPKIIDVNYATWSDLDSQGISIDEQIKQHLISNNFDGVIVKKISDPFIEIEGLDYLGNTYIVAASEQIKLADGTNTTFDKSNPDIRFEDGGMVKKETMFFWHGGDLSDYNELIAQKAGRYEYGAGLYLTTELRVATKYSKGSRKLYLIEVEKGVEISSASIPVEKVHEFIDSYVISLKRKDVKKRLEKYTTDGQVKANVLNNIILNDKAIQSTKTYHLREFYVQNGIDYEIVDNAYGWGETMMVLYNMKKIVSKKIVSEKDAYNMNIMKMEDGGLINNGKFTADISDASLSVDKKKKLAANLIKKNNLNQDGLLSFISRAIEKNKSVSVNNIFDLAFRIAKLDNKPVQMQHFAEAIMYDIDRTENGLDVFSISVDDVIETIKAGNQNYFPANKERMSELGIVDDTYNDRKNKLVVVKKKVESLPQNSKTLLLTFLKRYDEDIREANVGADQLLQLVYDIVQKSEIEDFAEAISNSIQFIEDKQAIQLKSLPAVENPLESEEKTEEALRRFPHDKLMKIKVYSRSSIQNMIDEQLKKSKKAMIYMNFAEMYNLPAKVRNVVLNEDGKVLLLDKNGKEMPNRYIKNREEFVDLAYKVGNNQNNSPYQISKTYHKAKVDGSNPELVKAVEGLLGGQKFKKGGAVITESALSPEQQKLVRTPEFKAWFGDWENDPEKASKIVDENGEPIVCYHGTNRQFNIFDKNVGYAHDAGFYGKGFYFTFQKEVSMMKYAKSEAGYYGKNVRGFFINARNPFNFDLLTMYKGVPMNVIGASTIAFLYNLAKMFPELADGIFLEKKTYVSASGEYETSNVPISVLPELVDNYASKLITRVVHDSWRGEDTITGYVKSEVIEYDNTEFGGKKGSYISYDDLGNYPKNYRKEEIEFLLIVEAIEKYDNIEARYMPEGYMTRNPQITEAIKKNHDCIMQTPNGDELIVFEPTQIKLADGTNVTFDGENPDVRFEDGGFVQEDSATIYRNRVKGSDVETGKSVVIKTLKNKEKAPYLGSRYGQDVEPAGNYVIQRESSYDTGWQRGEVRFENPLVIDVTDDTLVEWKRDLSKLYSNKRNKVLTRALQRDGFDGIITRKDNELGEIIIFENANYREIYDRTLIDPAQKPSFRKGGDLSLPLKKN